MPDFAQQVGARLRAIRIAAEVTQKELAAKMTVSRSYLSRLENGEFDMRLDTMEQLCRALHIQPEELMRGVRIDV